MSGYVYRGTQRDVTQPARPAPARKPKPKPVFNPEHCGTTRGYAQHIKTGTPKCQPCKDANTAYSRDYWARRKTGQLLPRKGFDPSRCGDRKGYLHHRRHKVPPCQPCREANSRHSAEYRAKRKQRKE
jgi:hypothetical protein